MSYSIAEGKDIADEFPISIDFAAWLGSETISEVVYAAKNARTGADATTEVLNAAKHSLDGSVVKPWIKGGVSGQSYVVSIRITTIGGAKKTVKLTFIAE